MYTMLHYPSINPPRLTVFEAVLYWDNLSTVVPLREYPDVGGRANDSLLSPDLRLLEQEGLYSPLVAEDLIDNGEAVLYDMFDEMRSAFTQFGAGGPPPDPSLDVYSGLWYGKIPYYAEEMLVEQGMLAPRAENEGAWRINTRVLQSLMAVLARYLGQRMELRQRGRFVPCTSDDFAHLCATAPLAPPRHRSWAIVDSSRYEVEHSWLLNVSNALPVPDSDAALEDVLEFRQEFEEEREICVRAVAKLQQQLSLITNNPTELLLECEREIKAAVTELRGAGRARFKHLAARSILVMVATGATYAGTAALDLPAVIASASSVAAGYALTAASAPTRPRDEDFNYIYQLERAFPRTEWTS